MAVVSTGKIIGLFATNAEPESRYLTAGSVSLINYSPFYAWGCTAARYRETATAKEMVLMAAGAADPVIYNMAYKWDIEAEAAVNGWSQTFA